MKTLVINCGGSSVKYQLVDMPSETVLAHGSVERIGKSDAVLTHEAMPAGSIEMRRLTKQAPVPDHRSAISLALEHLLHRTWGSVRHPKEIDAVGHRVVHGGETYTGSVRVTSDVIRTLEDHYELAPLHNPPNVTGIKACQELMPHALMVAVFDNGLHQTMPAANYMYAIPYEYYEKHRVRRYGFHGITFRYMTSRVAELQGRNLNEMKIVSLMLGSGTTANAFCHGHSVDVSTGLTPTEGLVQSTRCGDIDPLAVTFLMRKEGLSPEQVDDILNKQSGWLGISGVSNDFREVALAAEQGSARARLAIDAFIHRTRKYIGAYAAVMGGIDTLVFSGGLGERSTMARAGICAGLEFLGIQLDQAANEAGPAERCISTGPVQVWVLPTNEEIVIARDTFALAQSGDSYLSHVV